MAQKTYMSWLNNAHGQEVASIRMYEMHLKDASAGLNDFPELYKGLEKHLNETRKHAELMRSCVMRITGMEPFQPKVWFGEISGLVLGLTGDITIDKVIMNNLTDYGTEGFEIAAYHTLKAGALRQNDIETAKVCDQILEEEIAMQEWLKTQLAPVATEFLKRTGERG